MLAAFVGKGQRAEGSPAPSSRSRSPLSGLRLSPDPPEQSETGRLWMELGDRSDDVFPYVIGVHEVLVSPFPSFLKPAKPNSA